MLCNYRKEQIMITTDKVNQYAQRYDLKYEQALDILQKEEEDEQKKE